MASSSDTQHHPSPKDQKVRFVCISDTHNDDCTGSLPDGDVLLHSGDLTDFGTMEELQAAYNWISALPHKTKIVIAGNHEMGLDPNHKDFLPEALSLFTSEAARAAGVHYIDRSVQEIQLLPSSSGSSSTVSVYANPCQPEFLGKPYAFIYPPHPSPEATAAWEGAPATSSVPIWVNHGPPLGRLDWIPIPPLTGCAVQAQAIARARPVLTVFGHYHISHGVEVVTWDEAGPDGKATEKVETLVKDGAPAHLDFTTPELRFERGEKTIFVNAAWMTLAKPRTEERYQPVVLDLPLDLLT
ncbi:Metallo-dependent phosphatase-like protein [Podospora didyma]|uniref:Metallo-dependent phosphatase-like protein n=1 Tax=Podospora didyma TaxID=330526 RepID=A0AAE0NQ32_9PEZI|nr:Metallo-dependent phosphatase-like protein [Podospora didyma]